MLLLPFENEVSKNFKWKNCVSFIQEKDENIIIKNVKIVINTLIIVCNIS